MMDKGGRGPDDVLRDIYKAGAAEDWQAVLAALSVGQPLKAVDAVDELVQKLEMQRADLRDGLLTGLGFQELRRTLVARESDYQRSLYYYVAPFGIDEAIRRLSWLRRVLSGRYVVEQLAEGAEICKQRRPSYSPRWGAYREVIFNPNDYTLPWPTETDFRQYVESDSSSPE